jgi:hypothetical protein
MSFKFPKQQRLHQESERDCSVAVFAALTGLSKEVVCLDLPGAPLGVISVGEWIDWLKGRSFEVLQRTGCPDDRVPCAHLVGPLYPGNQSDFHWVYRDEDGDIHDPSPSAMYMPASHPSMRDLSAYSQKVLTISISRPSSR